MPALAAAVAARRVGRRAFPAWLSSPGDCDTGVRREIVACDPVVVVRGSSVEELESTWATQRLRWGTGMAGVPVGLGFLSYDLGRQFEPHLVSRHAPTSWPDIEFRFHDAVWMRDVATGICEIWAQDTDAATRLARIISAAEASTETATCGLTALVPEDPAAAHLAGIVRVLAYLRAGDVYQVNLARRLGARVSTVGAAPIGLALFEALQEQSPAPHALWLADPASSVCLIGNSPERFLALGVDGVVETRPIKGTRARGLSPDDDARTAAALTGDPKERAEHVMIVDLERNDLGRVCRSGSVEVVDLMRVVSLPTVHHLVTTVRGRLRDGVGLSALLRATFPGGSVTGAPKIRAMQIIDDLECARRGPYTGATGWLGAAGDLDLAVAIRTATLRGPELSLWVGGGIVADSIPEAELAETDAKAAAFTRLGGRVPGGAGPAAPTRRRSPGSS